MPTRTLPARPAPLGAALLEAVILMAILVVAVAAACGWLFDPAALECLPCRPIRL